MAAKGGASVHLVFNRLPELIRKVPEETRDVIKTSTENVETGAKRQLYPGHGVRTGTLRRSIHHRFEEGGFRGVVATAVHYAPYVEFGTSRWSGIPYLRPALSGERARFLGALERLLQGP